MNTEVKNKPLHPGLRIFWGGAFASALYEEIASQLVKFHVISLSEFPHYVPEPLTHGTNLMGSFWGTILVRAIALEASNLVQKKTNNLVYSNFTRDAIYASGITLIAAVHIFSEMLVDIPKNVEDRMDAVYGVLSLLPAHFISKDMLPSGASNDKH